MSSGRTLGRPLSPDSTRSIWSAVRRCNESGIPATVENIAERTGPVNEWNQPIMEQVERKVRGALDYGLLSAGDAGGGTRVFTTPTSSDTRPPPDHDWYCFECHLSSNHGVISGCATCFRVYHPLCLNMPELAEAEFSCPACVSTEKQTSLDPSTLQTQLDSIMMFVFNKVGAELSVRQLNSKLNPHEYRALIARDIDLAAMRSKLQAQGYPTPRHFFADFQLLVHNVLILHGKDSPLAETSQELLKQVRSEVEGLEVGVGGDNNNSMMETSGASGGDSSTNNPAAGGGGRSLARSSASSKRSRSSTNNNNDSSQRVDDETGWAIDDRFKKVLMDLQRYWLTEYQQSREKVMVDLTEKLHTEFLSDQQKIRTELLTQFKDELDATRQELEQKYRDNLKSEMSRISEKHKKDISNTKKKQWCWQCEAEAIYHCCWNTAYCSVECQQAHWPTHRKYCRRKKAPNAS